MAWCLGIIACFKLEHGQNGRPILRRAAHGTQLTVNSNEWNIGYNILLIYGGLEHDNR